MSQLPADSVVLEIDGKAFQAGCANGRAAGGFGSGATCGSAGVGAGPGFQSIGCNDDPYQVPIYFVSALFHGFAPAGIDDGTTFDLAAPDHEAQVTVMMNYMDVSRNEYHYCTAPPVGVNANAYPASWGSSPYGNLCASRRRLRAFYQSEVVITDAVVPTADGGPAIKIVAAHLYFQ